METTSRVPRAESRGYNVYMALSANDELYVGVTRDLAKRIDTHNSGRGANFTKQGNFSIVFLEYYESLAEARRREIQIKKWRREKKEALIERFNAGKETKMGS